MIPFEGKPGVTYEPDSGLCVRGPGAGLSLIRLSLVERDGAIYFNDGEYAHGD